MDKKFEPKLATALKKAIKTFETEGIKYAIIGGIAAVIYGSERSTMDIDLLIPVLPFFQTALNRAKKIDIFDFEAFVVTPEDLIVLKSLSPRPEDKMDIEIMAAIYGKKLGTGYIKDWLKKMVPANDERMGFFEGCMARQEGE